MRRVRRVYGVQLVGELAQLTTRVCAATDATMRIKCEIRQTIISSSAASLPTRAIELANY